MASKRIWSESTLIWDKAGSELWNLVQKLPFMVGGDGDGDSDFQDWEDEQLYIQQPTIIVSNLIPDFSNERKILFERAGISIGSYNRKQINGEISLFITDVKIK